MDPFIKLLADGSPTVVLGVVLYFVLTRILTKIEHLCSAVTLLAKEQTAFILSIPDLPDRVKSKFDQINKELEENERNSKG